MVLIFLPQGINFNVSVIPWTWREICQLVKSNSKSNVFDGILFLVITVPLVSANGMQTCDGNSGSCTTVGRQDMTPNQQDWINGSYDFKLVGTDQIQLSMVWAIHEFNRSAIGFGDSSIYSGFLATDGIGEHDGAPGSLTRNYG